MKHNENPEVNYSIYETNLFNKIEEKLHLDNKRWKLAFIALFFTWLPIVILSAIDGTLYSGTSLPFLKDYAMHGRLLFGIPILILIRNPVYRRLPSVFQYVLEVLLQDKDKDRFIRNTFTKARKNTNSTLTSIVILLLVAAFTFSPAGGASLFSDYGNADSWVQEGNEGKKALSKAGFWMYYIAVPVFQSLLIGWVWKYLVWIWLLFKTSRNKLNLEPTHPDGSGGLSIIFIAQRNFVLLFLTFGLVISSEMIASLIQNNSLFDIIKVEIIGYIIFGSFMVVFPMFFFTPQLIRTKMKGQLDLSKAGKNLSIKFENEFVQKLGNQKQITENTVDPSMQVDYSGVYILLQEMRTVPIRLPEIFSIAAILFIPFIPIFFIHYSIVELLEKLMGLLF